jgi:periplasmic mercuric ion binding protein
MKKLLSIFVLAASGSLMAESIHIEVKGMVCSFCAQGITKKFKAEKAIDSVHVNLDEYFVHLETKSEISDERIRKIITDAGYTVSSIKRN